MKGTSYAILSRYVAHGLQVRRLNPNMPQDKIVYSIEPEYMSDHPINMEGFVTKYEAVLPLLRPWEALLTHVDKNGTPVIQQLVELGLDKIASYHPLAWQTAHVEKGQDWIQVKLSTQPGSKRSLYINRKFDMWWTDTSGSTVPLRNQVARHQYLIENLFALGLGPDEFFPLV